MNEAIFTRAPEDSGVPASARDFSVKDRVVVITGAGQGIGREFARQFAAAGALPVVADLDLDKAQRVVAEIEAAGGRPMVGKVDVGDRDSVDALVAAVLRQHGRIGERTVNPTPASAFITGQTIACDGGLTHSS